MTPWLLLIASLPTQATAHRMRVWRTLKACGAATLRDGVYALPDSPTHRDIFDSLRSDVITTEGGDAIVFCGHPDRDEALQPLFDRTSQYHALLEATQSAREGLSLGNAKATEKELRKLWKNFRALQAIDFFPIPGVTDQVSSAIQALEFEIQRLLSPDEPQNIDAPLTPLATADYQQRQWATRKRPWVDRLASAWLIQRFIDANAHFVWLDTITDVPTHVIGFDFDGAMFSHHQTLVTFETLMTRFCLEEPALRKLAAVVHFLDVGGIEPAEAEGIRQVLAGLRESITDDDQLLSAANIIFDGLFLAFKRDAGAHTNE